MRAIDPVAFATEWLSRLEAGQYIAVGALVVARILPVVFIAPFFGGPSVPAPVKMAVSLTLAAVMFPAVQSSMRGALPEGPLLYLALLTKELAIGFAIAFVSSLVFRAAEMAGQAVDVLRGANMVTALAPELGERVSVIADFWVQTLVVLFFLIGGHHLLLAAFAESYVALPLLAFPSPAAGLGPAAEWIVRLSGQMFVVALALAAPALVALLLADFVLGLAARVAPNIQVFFMGMPLKALLGLAMILFAANALMSAFGSGLQDSLEGVRRLIDLLR